MHTRVEGESLKPTRAVLGLLGGIGSGKSHVARRLASLGPATVVDADALAHEALEAAAADGRLSEALGAQFVEAGKPDVQALSAQVFADAALLRRLERLLHPPCHAAIQAAIEAHPGSSGPTLLVLDVALLIEVGLDRSCDALWYVEVPDDVRVERAAGRGLSLDEIRRREAFQSPQARKRARADLIIHNNVDAEALDRQILAGLEQLARDLDTEPV